LFVDFTVEDDIDGFADVIAQVVILLTLKAKSGVLMSFLASGGRLDLGVDAAVVEKKEVTRALGAGVGVFELAAVGYFCFQTGLCDLLVPVSAREVDYEVVGCFMIRHVAKIVDDIGVHVEEKICKTGLAIYLGPNCAAIEIFQKDAVLFIDIKKPLFLTDIAGFTSNIIVLAVVDRGCYRFATVSVKIKILLAIFAFDRTFQDFAVFHLGSGFYTKPCVWVIARAALETSSVPVHLCTMF